MTQDLSVVAANSESGSESSMVMSVSIADPYVVLRMTDGSIRLLIGGVFHQYSFPFSFLLCANMCRYLFVCISIYIYEISKETFNSLTWN